VRRDNDAETGSETIVKYILWPMVSKAAQRSIQVQISQVSNELRENRRTLFNNGSRNAVCAARLLWNG